MGSFKALLLAGVTSFATIASASAADLFLPPPPPVEPAYVPVNFVGGFYLRGDVGVGISDDQQRLSSFAPGYNVPDLRNETSTFGDSAIVDFGVGYRFNNYFRADVTGEYRTRQSFNAVESYNADLAIGAGAGRGNDFYTGSVRSVVGLVNGYVDLGTWYGLTPFIGAGVGVANNTVGTIVDQGAVNGLGTGAGFGYSRSHDTTQFAFAAMAGVAFNVTPNTKIELGYRYLNLGNASSGTIYCQDNGNCPNEVHHYRLQSNDIRIGVRYSFYDILPVLAQPPLVRKY